MEGKVLARIAAIVFIAVAITATIIEMTREDVSAPAPSAPAPSAPSFQPPADPLREGQRRCQEMGEAAANDPTCLRIWAETRDRFLGRTPAPATPVPNGGQ